ncbi:MAG: aspartate-semialdehyde dehydrogenase, aspartate-semialdehyde dehydrogenase [Candidatus Peregrinibacteria bacterium GW2011_GWE2_39_6]|nr:MAG: aspartate-semialdehyde dehydrogenase, aspartate-semialdehyde dehydrogenase [Candidatus Peregrinibacteria bacterium GW2011_GWE2_39_6]
MKPLSVGILGATGMVGQRLITLLENHPWFKVKILAASSRSAGKSYREAVEGRWRLTAPIPSSLADLSVYVVIDIAAITPLVDFVFSAIDLDASAIFELEDQYAAAGIPVVSNNSAHRWTPDVPMIIPEINPDHLDLISEQRKNRGWGKGFIVTKPNCSLQSYLPALAPLLKFEPESLFVTTMQAISGSGRLLANAPEIKDNVIPLPGEEEKSECEPRKILGKLCNGRIEESGLVIAAHCNRVATEDGHLAVVSVKFKNKPSIEQVLEAWQNWKPEPQALRLPSAPDPCLIYCTGPDRPQTKLDRDNGQGMSITLGRLRKCPLLDYRFSALSHNTIRGAAGGAILTAELLHAKNYL